MLMDKKITQNTNSSIEKINFQKNKKKWLKKSTKKVIKKNLQNPKS